MKKLISQSTTEIPLGTIGGGEGFGPWSQPGGIETASNMFSRIMSNIVGVMTIGGGIWFIFQFIIGAYAWMSAGGEQAKLQAARQRVSNAFIGLTILVAAYALIWVIGRLLGFEILQPQKLIQLIGPGK